MATTATPTPIARSTCRPAARTPCSCTALPVQVTRCRPHHRIAFFALQAFTSCHAAISTLQTADCPSAIRADQIISLGSSSATEDHVDLVAELMGLAPQAETSSNAYRPLNLAFIAPKKQSLRLRDVHVQLRTFLAVRKGVATRRDIGRELALIFGIDLDKLAQQMLGPGVPDKLETIHPSSFSCVFTYSKLATVSEIVHHDDEDESDILFDEPMTDKICMADLTAWWKSDGYHGILTRLGPFNRIDKLARYTFAGSATLKLWLDADADLETYFHFEDLQARLEKLCAAANGMPGRGICIKQFARVIAQQFQHQSIEQRYTTTLLARKAAEAKLPSLLTAMRLKGKAKPVAGLTFVQGINYDLFYLMKVPCC